MDGEPARRPALERGALARLDQARRQSLRLMGTFALPLAALGAGAEDAAAQGSAESVDARRGRTALTATVLVMPKDIRSVVPEPPVAHTSGNGSSPSP